jgi:hypothetical protein
MAARGRAVRGMRGGEHTLHIILVGIASVHGDTAAPRSAGLPTISVSLCEMLAHACPFLPRGHSPRAEQPVPRATPGGTINWVAVPSGSPGYLDTRIYPRSLRNACDRTGSHPTFAEASISRYDRSSSFWPDARRRVGLLFKQSFAGLPHLRPASLVPRRLAVTAISRLVATGSVRKSWGGRLFSGTCEGL